MNFTQSCFDSHNFSSLLNLSATPFPSLITDLFSFGFGHTQQCSRVTPGFVSGIVSGAGKHRRCQGLNPGLQHAKQAPYPLYYCSNPEFPLGICLFGIAQVVQISTLVHVCPPEASIGMTSWKWKSQNLLEHLGSAGRILYWMGGYPSLSLPVRTMQPVK